jgi:sodium/potassium-transporting ATPase subunit alpha
MDGTLAKRKDTESRAERTPSRNEAPGVFVVRALPSPYSQINHTDRVASGGTGSSRSVHSEKELGEAGYEHIEAEKFNRGKATAGLANVDIQEHRLPLSKLDATFQTSINVKDPAQSSGLSSEEAKSRLRRFGPNILTPPRKKSTFRKVGDCLPRTISP